LRPILGCIGVAPPRQQVLVSHDLGAFGGNLDYPRLTAGATLYLPVFEPGAFLYLGDGHAAQGAGELTGDALEISMNVEVRVELLEGCPIPAPRAEDAEHRMASGIGGSLMGALQAATQSLASWLREDPGFDDFETAMVLGTSIQYDIAALVNPKYHVVARVNKSFQPNARRPIEPGALLRSRQ
jgi:acetamidase/formamidase